MLLITIYAAVAAASLPFHPPPSPPPEALPPSFVSPLSLPMPLYSGNFLSVSVSVSPFSWPPSLAGDLMPSSRRGAPGAPTNPRRVVRHQIRIRRQQAAKGRRGPIKYIRFPAATSAGGLGRGGWTRRAHRRCRGPGAHPPAPAAHEVQVKGHAAPPPCSTALPTCRRCQPRLRARPSLAAAATRQPASAAMGW